MLEDMLSVFACSEINPSFFLFIAFKIRKKKTGLNELDELEY